MGKTYNLPWEYSSWRQRQGLWVGWESARLDRSNLGSTLFSLRLPFSPNSGKYGPTHIAFCLHIFTLALSFTSYWPNYPPTSNNTLILKSKHMKAVSNSVPPEIQSQVFGSFCERSWRSGLHALLLWLHHPYESFASNSESSWFEQYCLFSQWIASLTNPMAFSLISLGHFKALALVSYFKFSGFLLTSSYDLGPSFLPSSLLLRPLLNCGSVLRHLLFSLVAPFLRERIHSQFQWLQARMQAQPALFLRLWSKPASGFSDSSRPMFHTGGTSLSLQLCIFAHKVSPTRNVPPCFSLPTSTSITHSLQL